MLNKLFGSKQQPDFNDAALYLGQHMGSISSFVDEHYHKEWKPTLDEIDAPQEHHINIVLLAQSVMISAFLADMVTINNLGNESEFSIAPPVIEFLNERFNELVNQTTNPKVFH